jgi:hypothetical protein
MGAGERTLKKPAWPSRGGGLASGGEVTGKVPVNRRAPTHNPKPPSSPNIHRKEITIEHLCTYYYRDKGNGG